METDEQRNKIDAIYELRHAAEAKAHAEVALEQEGTPEARDVLLEAQLEVEAKTQAAIDVCHECGLDHGGLDPHRHHARVSERRDNVIAVDFRPEAERA